MSVARVQTVSPYDEVHAQWMTTGHVVSIEDLRQQFNSCFTCGVNWQEEHVSLDCRECGGYSLERPCPRCDGHCGSRWKRDLATSHSSSKAQWEGECLLDHEEGHGATLIINALRPEEQDRIPRLEKLAATS